MKLLMRWAWTWTADDQVRELVGGMSESAETEGSDEPRQNGVPGYGKGLVGVGVSEECSRCWIGDGGGSDDAGCGCGRGCDMTGVGETAGVKC